MKSDAKEEAMASTITLKLLVDKKNHRVICAEASKEFVDFLFYILSLPVGTIVSLLTKEVMVGSLGNLYESIENLSSNYMQPNLIKDCILKPKVSNSNVNVNLFALPANVDQSTTHKTFYRCTSNYSTDCRLYVADNPGAKCLKCNNQMGSKATYVASSSVSNATSSSEKKGYVKEVVTYTVLDNLVVKPMSTISAITLLSTLNVRDLGVLEEKEVNFGMDESVKLLKASLNSKTVLTDVFLEKKNA